TREQIIPQVRATRADDLEECAKERAMLDERERDTAQQHVCREERDSRQRESDILEASGHPPHQRMVQGGSSTGGDNTLRDVEEGRGLPASPDQEIGRGND